MAVLKYENGPCQVGRKVHSKAVGKCPAFDGEIVEDFGRVFHVKDASGKLWRRNKSELEPMKKQR